MWWLYVPLLIIGVVLVVFELELRDGLVELGQVDAAVLVAVLDQERDRIVGHTFEVPLSRLS